MTSRTRPLLALVLTGALVVAGCSSSDDDKPDPAVRALVESLVKGLESGDLADVQFDSPEGAQQLTQAIKPLRPYESKITIKRVDQDVEGVGGDADITWKTSFGDATWEHTTNVSLGKDGGTWKVRYDPSIVEESLEPGETLTVTSIKAPRGDILGAGDEPLVEPRPVVRFGIDKAQAPAGTDFAAAAARLAALVDVDPGSYAKQVTKAGPKAYVEAITLRRSDVGQRLLAGVEGIPGGRAISDTRPLAPTKDFAAALLGTVGPATAELIEKSDGRLRAGDDAGLSGLQARYDEQLGGDPGVKVSAGEPDAEPRVLFEVGPTAGQTLQLTLDRRLQAKAQDLLDRYGPASALVAVRPSTGAILVAASGPGSKGYNTATFGQYAPGSTFKVVSSLALLRSGLKPSSQVSCPAQVVVNGKKFTNYSDYPANRIGTITLEQAVANSCNTAFISERGRIEGSALADAAASLGFGVDHDMGFPSYFGQVPPPQSETEAAADLIGQGKILASPMVMAAVIASVVEGSTVVPTLIAGKDVRADVAKPLTGAEADSLRTLLRAVVREGSGAFLQSLGSPAVLAKTGTAEFGTSTPLKTHTWMIGAQGDLAVAVFVDVGESGSRTAGPVLEDFLRFAKR